MTVRVAIIYYSATGTTYQLARGIEEGANTSAATSRGGQESTIIAINNTFYHWGAIIVSPGYADPSQFQFANPYGVFFTSNNRELKPGEVAMTAARFQGRRVGEVAARFLAGRKS